MKQKILVDVKEIAGIIKKNLEFCWNSGVKIISEEERLKVKRFADYFEREQCSHSEREGDYCEHCKLGTTGFSKQQFFKDAGVE